MELAIFFAYSYMAPSYPGSDSLLFWDFGLHVTTHFWAELEGRHRHGDTLASSLLARLGRLDRGTYGRRVKCIYFFQWIFLQDGGSFSGT